MLVTLEKTKYMYILTGMRLIMSTAIDTLLVSSLPCSLKLGVNGIAITNIIVNGAVLVVSLVLLHRQDVSLFTKQVLNLLLEILLI